MKLILENSSEYYGFDNIFFEEGHKNCETYCLEGVSAELISLAQKHLQNKLYFNCKIQKENEALLVGEHCWFNNISPFEKKLFLIVNQVISKKF